MNAPSTPAIRTGRIRVLRVSAAFFIDMFKPGEHSAYNVVSNGIPYDTRLLNVRFAWPEQLELLIASDQFDEVKEGDVIPYLTPVISRE